MRPALYLVTIGALCAVTVLPGADPGAELVWVPPVDVHDDLVAAEHRPLVMPYRSWFTSAMAMIGSERRRSGLLERQRADDLTDGVAVIGWTDGAARLGERSGFHANADAWRRLGYLRGGTDPQAGEGGVGFAALGFASVTSWGGGPTGIWVEGGWSDEREMLLRAEAMAFLTHVVAERDADQMTLRCGLALRWPGQPVARTPQDDPWSFAASVDWIYTDTVGDGANSFAADVTLGWRIFRRVQLLAHGEGVGATIGDSSPAASGSLGLGIGF